MEVFTSALSSRAMTTLGKDTKSYYRFHSRIYDLTRWAFLFGRSGVVDEISKKAPKRVMEIGCGTGRNLIQLKKYCPEVECIGVDSSEDMLDVAKKKSKDLGINWMLGTYPSHEVTSKINAVGKPDVILFSYALSMFNPGWEDCLDKAHEDVSDEGGVFLVDFHLSSQSWFKKWMGCNHVKMEGQLLEKINSMNRIEKIKCHQSPLGVWEWIQYSSTPKKTVSVGDNFEPNISA